MLSGQTQLFSQSWDREGCITFLRIGHMKAGSTENLMDMNLGKFRGMVRDRKAWWLQFMGLQELDTTW